MKTITFEARTSIGSIIQNIGDKGLCEELFRFTTHFFNSKTIHFCEKITEKSRQNIAKKKQQKIQRTKMLKMYASKSTVPRYKRQGPVQILTGTYLDTIIQEDDEEFEEDATLEAENN